MKRHASHTRRQGGFTLVEIAIVLMIVGLLIGGILRGQELIQSARVRNIIDQKSSIQTAYIGFLDRYRMLPGDLTINQAPTIGNGALASTAGGDGQIEFGESTLFFQNLTAAGFLSCGACMTVPAGAAGAAVTGPFPTTANTPVNVYGDFITASNELSGALGFWFSTPPLNVNRFVVDTGGSVPSQVLAEVDRKADDGLPGSGQLRVAQNGARTAGTLACAPGIDATPATTGWANPSQANCMAAWLF